MSRKKIIIIGIAVLILGILIIPRLFGAANPKNGTETALAIEKTISEDISAAGKIKANQQVDLHFQTGGNLAWVGVKEGDTVSAYQAIASLDRQELDKNLTKALRDYSKERNDFEEDRRDTYRNTVLTDTVKRILEKNQWDLEKAVLDVELKDIALKWATLVTPIAGIVTHIDTPVAGVNILYTNTFSIADPASLVFTSNVDEVDVGKMKIGQTAEIALDAFPNKTFTGTVSKIAFAAEVSAGGATVFPVEISFNDIADLRVGLNGDVTIKISQIDNVLSVPNDAIKNDGKDNYVIKKDGNQYSKVIIKIGLVGNDDTQIIEGLKSQDQVVIKGFEKLPKNLQI